jgi:hypothetical protein
MDKIRHRISIYRLTINKDLYPVILSFSKNVSRFTLGKAQNDRKILKYFLQYLNEVNEFENENLNKKKYFYFVNS